MADKAKRVARLDNVGAVLTEMGRVYREARRGEISTSDAARFCAMLRQMRETIELNDLEHRMTELEREYELLRRTA